MLALFPGRTRPELKRKFKREEKFSKHLIDKAISKYHARLYLFCDQIDGKIGSVAQIGLSQMGTFAKDGDILLKCSLTLLY